MIFLYFEECPPLIAVESRSPLVSIISHFWSEHDSMRLHHSLQLFVWVWRVFSKNHSIFFSSSFSEFWGMFLSSAAWSRRSFSNSGRVSVHKSKVSSIIWRGLNIRGNLNGDDSEACQKGMPQNAETKEPKRQFISDLLPMQVFLDLPEFSSIPLPI